MIAPASTGRLSSSRIAVTKIAQTNSGSLCSVIPGFRIFSTVVITILSNNFLLVWTISSAHLLLVEYGVSRVVSEDPLIYKI